MKINEIIQQLTLVNSAFNQWVQEDKTRARARSVATKLTEVTSAVGKFKESEEPLGTTLISEVVEADDE